MALDLNSSNRSFLEKNRNVRRKSLKSQFNQSVSEKKTNEKNEKCFFVRFLDWIVGFSLFAIFLGVPLFFTGFSYQGLIFEKQIYFYFFALLALLAWVSRSGYLGEIRISRTPLDIPILIFWLSYLISTIFSIDRWHSFFGFFGDPSRGFLNVTALVVVYYLITSNFSEKLFKWILRGIFISGFIVSSWTLLSLFGVNARIALLGSLPFSFVGSLSSTALFLMMLIPLSVMKIADFKNKHKKGGKIITFLHLFLIILNLFVLFLIYVYSFWLALLIGMVVFLIFVLAKVVEIKNGWALLPMIIFVLVLVFLMVGPVSFLKNNMPISVDVPFGASFEIAKKSLGDSFFFGSGVASFGYSFSKYLPAGFDNFGLRFSQGQGLFLENFSTIGVVGAVFFGVLVLTYLGVFLFFLSRDREKNKIKSLGFFTASVVLLVGVLGQRTEGAILIFWVLLSAISLAVVYWESGIGKRYFNFSLKASPKFALTLAFVYLIVFAGMIFMFVFVGKVYLADIKVGGVARASEKINDDSVERIMRAIDVNPREGMYYVYLSQSYMTLTNGEMLKGEDKRNMNKIRQYLSLAIQAGKKGEDLMRNSIVGVESLAQIYENAGIYITDAYDLSEEKYGRASELEPFNPSFLVKLGQVKIKKSQQKETEDERMALWEEAKKDYEKAIKIRPSYAKAFSSLSLAEEGLGNKDAAIEKMSQAFLLERSNINYAFNLARLHQERGTEDDFKISESLYGQILEINDKDINALFGLGMVYEKTNRKEEAIAKYQKVLSFLDASSNDLKGRINKMIDNVRAGVLNTPESLGLIEENQTQNETGDNSQLDSQEQEGVQDEISQEETGNEDEDSSQNEEE